MKVELKNVKYAAFASEDSNCFTATIYIDGKKVGRAENNGMGGCTYLTFFEPNVQTAYLAWAKTQPAVKGQMGDITMDGELYIDILMDEWLKAKDDAKLAKKGQKEKERFAAQGFKCLELRFGDSILWMGIRDEAAIPKAVEAMQKKYKFTENTAKVI